MAIEFDPDKNQRNYNEHGLWLSDFDGFDSGPAVLADDRNDYGENRFRAFGRVGGEGRCLVYTFRSGNLRLISFRRSREKEMRRYDR